MEIYLAYWVPAQQPNLRSHNSCGLLSLWCVVSGSFGATVISAPFKGKEMGACRKPVKQLDDEGRQAAVKSMLDEFVSSNDKAEAITCVQEINAQGIGLFWLSSWTLAGMI